VTSAGAVLDADFVIAGIGAAPNVSLAADAGLDVEGGIATDASLRTSDPDIFAAGDVASAFNPLLGRRITVQHWSNALNGGPAAARAMLGQDVSYDRVPYFFTDQYDLGMETAGLPEPGAYDQVAYRGDPESGEFIAFWLSGGLLVAGMNVNVWDVQEDIQALIRARQPVDAARLADPGIRLNEV
jgi:NADPH-dependent 2,4-dienoyl-CoA reductase/sulfur reductase-like enzyme